MTDQIYYKVQYPLKNAINILKQIDEEAPAGEERELTEADFEAINDFLKSWHNGGREKLQKFVRGLRQKK